MISAVKKKELAKKRTVTSDSVNRTARKTSNTRREKFLQNYVPNMNQSQEAAGLSIIDQSNSDQSPSETLTSPRLKEPVKTQQQSPGISILTQNLLGKTKKSRSGAIVPQMIDYEKIIEESSHIKSIIERLAQQEEEMKRQKESQADVAKQVEENQKHTRDQLTDFSNQTIEVIKTIEKNREDQQEELIYFRKQLQEEINTSNKRTQEDFNE